jgi:hypothetical protein
LGFGTEEESKKLEHPPNPLKGEDSPGDSCAGGALDESGATGEEFGIGSAGSLSAGIDAMNELNASEVGASGSG